MQIITDQPFIPYHLLVLQHGEPVLFFFAFKTIKKDYDVMYTVTFGSPLIDGIYREGTIKHLGDKHDIVPYLSVSTITKTVWQAAGLNREDGGYGRHIIDAHCQSYQRDDVWGRYDSTGDKDGGRTLTVNFSTTQFYYSPVTAMLIS